MSIPKFYNSKTGKWEPFISSNAVPIIDKSESYEGDNVEAALQELAAWKKELGDGSLALINNRLDGHDADIKWLKANGGGGGGGGAAVPTIESSLDTGEKIVISAGSPLDIPVIFKSANLGNGTAYVIINDVPYDTETVAQGLNTLSVKEFPRLENTVMIYVKDRAGLSSNTITLKVINGGIGLELDFDYEANWSIEDEVRMIWYVEYGLSGKLKTVITVGTDVKEVSTTTGENHLDLSYLDVGIHNIKMYVTDGEYKSQQLEFSVCLIDSNHLILSTDFDEEGIYNYANPITIKYRISYAETRTFPISLYLDDMSTPYKTLTARRGSYYWIIDERIDVGQHNFKIVVDASSIDDGEKVIEGSFNVIAGDYTPLDLYQENMTFRLNPGVRSNIDDDKENPVINGCQATLHNFNFSSNGWIDGELVCNGGSYVELDFQPFINNAKYGYTIEVLFKTYDIGNLNAMVLDYRDPISANGTGCCIGLNTAQLNSEGNISTANISPLEVEMKNDYGAGSDIHIVQTYKEPDKYTKVSFVIDRRNKFAKIYINGILNKASYLKDTGSGDDKVYEVFKHNGKMYINYNVIDGSCGYCKIKDIVAYSTALTDEDILKNVLYYETDYREQKIQYDFNFNNSSLPKILLSSDDPNAFSSMTLTEKKNITLNYLSTNEEKYGQNIQDAVCEIGLQGTSSVGYVLKNYQVYLKKDNKDLMYTPYNNGILDNLYCFKCDYMESSHSRNVGLARFANDIIYKDALNPAQQSNPKVRNAINGFPCLLYINGNYNGVYNFNNDRYSNRIFGYTNPTKHMCFEISANSDSTAGAFFSYDDPEATIVGLNEIDYYKRDFMPIYPANPTDDAYNKIKRLVDFIDKAEEDNFIDNFEKYFNKEYVLRYLIFVQLFGLVDNLGKNMKIASWDGGNIWYIQPYDCDTSIGLDNSGVIQFGADIEMEAGTFNTSASKLWTKVIKYFGTGKYGNGELAAKYAEMRNNGLTIENMYKYIVEDQMEKIPAYYYNKDMQTKYLNYDNAYLDKLHGDSKSFMKKWLRDRLLYIDSFYDYQTDMLDNVTIRVSNKDTVFFDIETFTPMYFTVCWRNQSDQSLLGTDKLKVDGINPTRFEHTMETETDQEVILYCGRNIKRLGNLTNLKPASMMITNAYKLTELECHNPALKTLDLSKCINLVDVDLSGCTGIGTTDGQGKIDISGCDNLLKLNLEDTSVKSVTLNSKGNNIQELYLPASTTEFYAYDCSSLRTIGLQPDHICNTIHLERCKHVEAFGDLKWNESSHRYEEYNGHYLSGEIHNLYLDTSYDVEDIEIFYNLNIEKVTLKNLENAKRLILGPRINIREGEYDARPTYFTSKDKAQKYGNFSLETVNCPNFDEVTLRNNYKRKWRDEESYYNRKFMPSVDQDPTGSISYMPNFDPFCGFHCTNLDLTKTSIKKFNVYECAFIYKLALPETINEIHINSLKNLFQLTDSKYGQYLNQYEEYVRPMRYGYPKNIYDENEHNTVEAACPPVIYSISNSISSCVIDTWDLGWYTLTDFELGLYNFSTFLWWQYDKPQIHDCTHNLTIKNMNLKAHWYTPCFLKEWLYDINGTLDLTEYKGNYLIRTFAGINDNLKVKLPADFNLNNYWYVCHPLRGANTTQFDWKFARDVFSKEMWLDRCFHRTILKEQESEADTINLTNDVDVGWYDFYSNSYKIKSSDTTNVADECGIFTDSNIKYVGEVSTSCLTQGLFNNAKQLLKVGDCYFGNSNTQYIGTTLAYAFRNCQNVQTIGNIVVDTNNLTYNWMDWGVMLGYCYALTSVGKISIKNVLSSMISISNSGTTSAMVGMNSMFYGDSMLNNLPEIDLGGLKTNSMSSFANGCSKIKNFKMPKLHWDCSLSYAFYYCKYLTTIDFSESGIASNYYNALYRMCEGCTQLQTLPGWVFPQTRWDSKDMAFNNCSALRTYSPPGNSCPKHCTFGSCQSLQDPGDGCLTNLVHICELNTTGDAYGQYAYDKVKAIKTADVTIRFTSSVLNSVPNKITNKINVTSLHCENMFNGCDNITRGSIKIEDLGKISFVREANIGGMFAGTKIETLTFDENFANNVHDNIINISNFVNGSYIRYVENFPLNVTSGTFCYGFGSQIQGITWKGNLTTNFDINLISSSITNLPVDSFEDLLENHLGTLAGGTITLGTFKSLISDKALQAAADKGWTVK